jgi:ADP-ribose pyrophosphatase YjhB (NUDIX family)
MGAIRAVAIVALRHEGAVLLCRGYDSVKRRPFYRAPGGGIEFGEPASVAARREIAEELGIELDAPRHLGTIENLFECEGVEGHEVVFVFEAPWPGGSDVGDTIQGVESDGTPFTAHWHHLADLPPPDGELVPPGFLDLIRPPQS